MNMAMSKKVLVRETVLVGVLKSRNDQRILLQEHWYRIPAAFLPKRKFQYVAFYQPATFGRQGKQIDYYAKVSRRRIRKRISLLPREKDHPRAKDNYLKLEFKEVKKLLRPVKNIIPRRVYFGFTTLQDLFSARNILELYHVPPTEEIVGRYLKSHGIKFQSEFPVSVNKKRFRLDFAIIHNGKHVAIECDNEKAHANKLQRRKDKIKDAYLRRVGWQVIRLKERDVIENIDACTARVKQVISQSANSHELAD
ncbi:MAG: DUF559 domain-containing protein [Candidatus Colwellbacteria bacterium]